MRLRSGLLWIAFAALVAYLSFVPFHYRPLDVDEALARFTQIPYLNLGAGSRADWVANILMFLPLGWLGAAFFVPRPRHRFDPLAIVPSLLLGAAWAVAVEFGQLYFPNRTVSINDIVAEVIGTFLGAWLWSAFGTTSLDWWRTLLRGGRATANAALAAYLLAYLVLSFSPFDFVISADELAEKIHSDLNGWWLAPISCGRTPCSLKLVAEALAVVPFGWWLAMRQGGRGGSILLAAMVGASLGVLIELAQFLLVSGTSQGASVVSRGAGVAAGAWLHSSRDRILRIDWVRWGRLLALAGLIPWLAVVGYVAGWFGGRWLGLEAGLARLAGVEWMPFFYQYYSTEQALIRSTLVHLVVYAPVGVAVWLWGRRTNTASALAAALLAAMVAVVAESGKLFVPGKHPDYTDVLLAMVAAWAAATLMRWASSATIAVAGPGEVRPSTHRVAPRPVEVPSVASNLVERERSEVAAEPTDARFTGGISDSWGARAAAAVALILVVVSLLRFPVWQVPLALGLAAYAGLLARRPLAYLLIVPVALPVLDLAPLSGRLFWDEFDLLLATTVGIRLLMAQPPPRAALQLPKAGFALLALSVVVSTAIALWPPAPLDGNAFTNYLSPYNALRVGKGYLWAGALLWLLLRDAAARRDVSSRLQVGLGLGLLAASLGVLWERLLFVGVADFGTWFRAAGLVSATHVGGAYLEAMLVVLTPFALGLAATRRNDATGAFWLGVALLGAAAMLMTLSRAAAAAWLIAVSIFVVMWWFMARRRERTGTLQGWRLGLAAAAMTITMTGLMMAQSTALRDRLVHSVSDLGFRLAHWQSTLSLIERRPLHVLFGMGMGSFPREFYLAQAPSTPLAAYRLEREPGGTKAFIALVGGRGMYLDQRVTAQRGQELRLRGLVRTGGDRAELAVALCEKSYLASIRCVWARVPAGNDWQPFEAPLYLPKAPGLRIGPEVPLSLSLHNAASGKRIEVTQLSLLGGSAELLENGSFERGLDHWLMHSDEHFAWRSLNTWVQVVFEQGVLGALAWLILGAGFVAAALRHERDVSSVAILAAGVAIVAVGCFDSLLDAPRIVTLVALVAGAAIGPPRIGPERGITEGA